MRRFLRAALGAQDYRLAEAATAREGLAQAASRNPDVILLDLGMPGISGYELARRLRAHPTLARSRLIAVTGYAQERDRAATAGAGFAGHITKLVDGDELLALLG